jgi:hypothetical protein
MDAAIFVHGVYVSASQVLETMPALSSGSVDAAFGQFSRYLFPRYLAAIHNELQTKFHQFFGFQFRPAAVSQEVFLLTLA